MTRAADETRPAIHLSGLAGAPACDPGAPEECAICRDEALRARVLVVDATRREASVLLLEGTHGAPVCVALDLVDGVAAGDLVLLHQGFVISRLGESP